ncbi:MULTISPECIES: PBECR4 domain-containing protein [unclassified Streptococcus]|uniref:PBECR4 domain-containing protein n=1 Tax=unclassified Streptococcus TaxID=2608887 RepID=UPI00211AA710|nr:MULTISPECIES: PBECR4 domain-containing protein [unclassified Streptococcus]MCQ9211709.1 PBECR4 domain-containing protein [Streptococcus sp. B01]MCQ9213102.1 PBECR4 domain-containing protein [Streptococcus sp. O1]
MVFTKAQAKSLAILDVARSLGMEMKRSSHKEYRWTEHDSLVIDTNKNTWHWYSHTDKYGDTINLVQEMRGVSYREAMHYLETGTFPEAKPAEEVRQPFKYTLAPYEQPFREARTYLKEIRGLSEETIDFFLEKGVLAQARRKDRDGFTEDVLVFKYLDKNQNIVGASLQGLVPYTDRHEGKGYLKQIMYQSEGIAGLNVSIGSPDRLIVAEAPIDLMSYYELHKSELNNVRLVAMEGLKEGILSRYAMEALQERGVVKEVSLDYTRSKDLAQVSNFLSETARVTTLFHDGEYQDLITLAVDQDKAGSDFIERLREKNIPVIDARPPKGESKEKMDWNDYLNQVKKEKLKIEDTKKAPDRSQEPYSNAGDSHRNPDFLGDLSPGAASKPVVDEPQPDFPVIAPLQFTTKGEWMSTLKSGYHVITDGELKRLNKFAPGLQATAQWYLKELAGSTITYLYQDKEGIGRLDVQFSDENFAHLTGISPKEIETKQVVYDFASGKGDYGNIQVSHAIKDKSMVLPLLPDIISSQAFVFDDLSTVEKFHKIDLAQAIKTEDEDLLVALRDVDGIGVPASVMRIKEKLSLELEGKEKVVLGIYRERNGKVEQLSLNDDYIKDGGKQLHSLLQSIEQEEVKSPREIMPENTAYVYSQSRQNGEVLQHGDLYWKEDAEALVQSLREEGAIVFVSQKLLTKPEISQRTAELLVENPDLEWTRPYSSTESFVDVRGVRQKKYEIPDTNLEELKEKENLSPISQLDSDADGVSDDEELEQGTNPYDFRSKPGSRFLEENSLESEETVQVSSGLAVADFIKNKDLTGLNRHLKEGIKEYLNSDKYKDYLTKMSQLNNYSSRNLRLILAQNPEATQVASFKQWKETFGRHVKKGEKSIRIFAPMTKIKKDENNQPILDKNGKPETVTFFGLVPVFDVSQTAGKEMPKAVSEVKEQLTDLDYANLYRALMAIAKENDVSVCFDEMAGNQKGYYHVTEHQIVLRSNDMNKSQLIKTFIHETAHSELHHANNPQKEQLTRSTAELQAESVAYVVASYYGIDTSDYSFAYLAGWSDDKETLADLEAQLDIVQQEAKSLMVRMDQQLEQLRLSQEKQAKHQFEQKFQKFKDQSTQAIQEYRQEQKAEAHSKKEKGFSK